jgi:hypothetical protein
LNIGTTDMSKKLNSVEQSILSLMQEKEPTMLLWREIKAVLWPIHKKRYRDEKVFGVALSNYLTRHEGRLWKKEGGYWGTFRSSPPESKSLWDRLKHKFKQVGGYLVTITTQRASYSGRDPETGWRDYNYKIEVPIEGIMVLKRATELAATARSFEIYMKDEHDGIVLTSDSIGWPDHLLWRDSLYEVKDVEERDDGYNFSYNIAYFAELICDREEKETAEVHAYNMISDARSLTRTFLTTYLIDTNIVRDDGAMEATYCVIYKNGRYPIIKEFQALCDPVDGVYAVGEPETRQLFDAVTRKVYAHDEKVPIFVYTINKVGVTGTRLKMVMERELRRVCETYPIVSQQHGRLERLGGTHKQIGSITLYSTEFVLSFKRSIT